MRATPSPSLTMASLLPLPLLLLLPLALSQSFTPTNLTKELDAQLKNDSINLSLNSVKFAPLLALNPDVNNLPSDGLSGAALQVGTATRLNFPAGDVAFLSCDPSPGVLDAGSVFSSVLSNNPTAFVLYSLQADLCTIDSTTASLAWIFTLTSINDTSTVLKNLAGPPNAVIAKDASSSPSGGGGGQGPRVTTAVAMIILYSITALITVLFLVIITTGAIRARRHPERYGPRSVMGRPRQTRAGGLARAILDTLPVVKFDNKTASEVKVEDVELGNSSSTTGENQSNNPNTIPNTIAPAPNTIRGRPVDLPTEQSTADPAALLSPTPAAATTPAATDVPRASIERGIAAAVPTIVTNRTVPSSPNGPVENPECSICAESFEVGQDQRVLPCNHRFHPACIDPWLLNVSGTCPLCRIDLHLLPSVEAGDGGDSGGQDGEGEREAVNVALPHAADTMAGGEDSNGAAERRTLVTRFLRGRHRPETRSTGE